MALVASCNYRSRPPQVPGPEPNPHNGIFVAGTDTLVFNGDGETVSWSFADSIEPLAARGTGTYVFLFQHGKFRYDAAETFKIHDGKNYATFLLLTGPAAEDSMTLHWVSQTLQKTFTKIKEK